MSKVLIFLAVAILASGCSTSPNQMRSGEPDEVHTSFKSAKEVSLCIASSWEDWVVVYSRETENGYSVSGLLNGKLHYLADVKSHEGSSQTKVYNFMVLNVGRDQLFAVAAACQ